MINSRVQPSRQAANAMLCPCRVASARPFTSSRSIKCMSSASATTTTKPQLRPLDENYDVTHRFTEFANWLVPGHLMVGRYPYVEPSRCGVNKSNCREIGEEQLMQIISQGITYFVSLQGELPAQEKMTLAGTDGFLPYKATAELIKASMNGPPPREYVDGLRNPTLNAYLPPKKRQNEVERTGRKDLTFMHFPITDLGVPTMDQAKEMVSQLSALLENGERVYVHCWGGRGRAGTVGACVLAKVYGLSASEALDRVSLAFSTRGDVPNRSPETESQIAFVEAFVQQLKQ